MRRFAVVSPDTGSSLRVVDGRAATTVAMWLGSGCSEAQVGSRLAFRGRVCSAWLPATVGCVGLQRPAMMEEGIRRWASGWPFVWKASRHWCRLPMDEMGVQVAVEVETVLGKMDLQWMWPAMQWWFGLASRRRWRVLRWILEQGGGGESSA